MSYGILADMVVAVHVLFIDFVVLGLLAIAVGYFFEWRWVRRPIFRILHLAAILFVLVETIVGIDCPLTTLENALRRRAGQIAYKGQFIGHWLDRLIFYNFPMWIFVALYVGFGAVILAMLWLVPIESERPQSSSPTDR